MRNVVLAFATAMLVGGCGDNGGSLKLDGGNHDLTGGSNNDLTGQMPPDLSGGSAGQKNCGAIFQCVFNMGKSRTMCKAGKPQGAQDAFDGVDACMFVTYCGDIGDSSAGQPCAQGNLATDAGLATCNDCINNTLNGPMSFFVDMNGNPTPCVPTTAPECGKCVMPAYNCFTQCFTDADCTGFTMPLTCMGASGTTAGTCG